MGPFPRVGEWDTATGLLKYNSRSSVQTMGRRGGSLLPLAAAGLALIVALAFAGRGGGGDEDRDGNSEEKSSPPEGGHLDTTGGDTKARSGGGGEGEGEGEAAEHANNTAAQKSLLSIVETGPNGAEAVLLEIAVGKPPDGERPPEVFLLYEGGRVSDELRSKITRIRVGPQVPCIPDDAFRDCIKLAKVQMSEGLQTIGERAFQGCTMLQSVTLPSSVTEVGNWAFYGCRNLTELLLNEGLVVIGGHAFQCCEALQIITLPSTVTELGVLAFLGCSSLGEVQLNQGLRTVGEGTFCKCEALRSVALPLSITKLGKWAFYGCRNLTELRLNEGLQTIGDGAFAECTALRRITLPSSVKKLGKEAFFDCPHLVEVKLNEGLRLIGDLAFAHCIALRSITIPSSVTEIRYRAFGGCSNLSELILLCGERLLNQDFLACGIFSEEQGLLNQGALDEILFNENKIFTFEDEDCPLVSVKISISWAVSERMARLTHECRVSVEERIRNLPRLDLLLDGKVLACFPVVSRESEDGAEDDSDDEAYIFEVKFDVQDTNLETARSLHRVLQLIAFHELNESSILIELAMWKSRIGGAAFDWRADCRVPIPDPVKSLIMEYCGFSGFLESAIEGAYEPSR